VLIDYPDDVAEVTIDYAKVSWKTWHAGRLEYSE
jgi:hypothetical protein